MTTKLLRNTILISATLFLLGACNTKQQKSTSENTEAEKAPSFEVTTISGDTISLNQSLEEGKPVVIYFTASWCPICAQNWPVLSEVYPEYEDRLTLVAIGIDPTDDEETMRKLAEEKGFTFPVTRGLPDIMLDYGVDRKSVV